MSDSGIIMGDLTVTGGLQSPKLLNSDIKEELVPDDMLLFAQSEISEDPKFQIMQGMGVASNVDFNIPEFDEKQVNQLLTKYPIQLGQLCKFDSSKHEQTTHFVKYKLHDGKPTKVWECGICSKEFGHQYTLMRHLPTHTDERKFQCNTCGKAFRQMSTLSQHRAIHSAERPYVCEICHKTFNRVSTLISHRKTHTGLKPHRCHMCNKAFHQKGNLRNHIFTHTNERPYKCDLCTKGFNQMSNLMCHKIKAHQRADKPRYTCQICGKDFQKRMGLRNHEQYQHGVQNPEPSASQTNNVKYTNGVLVEPINTAAMQHALTNNQTPFALLRPLNGIPVLVRVLAAGEKQMLVPATAEDLKKHGQITITPQVDENKKADVADPLAQPDKPVEEVSEATIKSLGSTVQIKIPVVATVVQRYGKDGNMCMAIESPEPSAGGMGNQNYVLTTTATDNLDGVHPTIDYGDYTNFNFAGFVENNQMLTPSEIQYVDECGNVLNFDEYKAKSTTFSDEGFPFETQVDALPANLHLENNMINFPENGENVMNMNMNIGYVEGGSNTIFEILEKTQVISLTDNSNSIDSTSVPYDPSMCSNFIIP